ncbi:BglG family transcription antiterminator LicT [Clostridium tyrobutyricum]|uniref:BglG family transcription antiterminator LicT n=1 Tax=Clostridium tyrobutyricum TaxID=1519 RepID=UPI001C38B649|nr:PRD domain-containing protein [Clostridium tyrobutyricum]MBV4415782.1 PRD domain-containing protein [Clostridium tyrobutyricum]
MRIKKILNNNVITVIQNKREIIVMGRGIAFNKRPGDIVVEDKIEKTFELKDDNGILSKFKKLISDIPIEHMETADEIINYVKEHTNGMVNDQIYLSLTDHISFAVERYKKGIAIKNSMLWEMKKLYSKEFNMGMEALHIIKKRLDMELPEDEAAFIAFHIVNAEINSDMPELMNITKIVQDILSIVKYYFKINFDEESINYYRFLTHLKFFAHRVLKNTPYKAGDEFLYDVVKKQYGESYLCICRIRKYLEKTYNYKLEHEEMVYLIIHIERVVRRN